MQRVVECQRLHRTLVRCSITSPRVFVHYVICAISKLRLSQFPSILAFLLSLDERLTRCSLPLDVKGSSYSLEMHQKVSSSLFIMRFVQFPQLNRRDSLGIS